MLNNPKILHAHSELTKFFSVALPPPTEGQVFVAATPHPKKNPSDRPSMKHIYATTHQKLADAVLQIHMEGKDAYYALGKFMRHEAGNGRPGRKGAYVRELKSFWMDVDVGECKSINGCGYLTKKDGIQALINFVEYYNLPFPTHLIDSGGGIHAYWVLDKVVTPKEWKSISRMLKELAAQHGFLADPSRTADVASILRPPFTQNHKLTTPRDVLLKRSKPPVFFSEFAKVVSTAHAKYCDINALSEIPGTPPALIDLQAIGTNVKISLPPETQEEIEKVRTMLATIPANCPREKWRNIIWAVADTGWSCAEELARTWSKAAPEVYNENDFNRDWLSFDPAKANGVKFSTLRYYAQQHGWTGTVGNEAQIPKWLEKINQDYAWIEKEASIYRLKYGDFIDPNKFKLQHDNQLISAPLGNGTKFVGTGSAWLRHPKRRQHLQLVFKPKKGLITHDNCLNEWRGFAVEPIFGNVEPFLNLLAHLIPDKQARNYVLSWMAHLLQHPEAKIHASLVFWSHQQGVGKNLLFECLTSIIGKIHATIIGQLELAGSFNGWANCKVLVIGDEISRTDRRQDSDKLKGLITGTSIYINEKYQPAREVPNFLNFIFLSNHPDTLFINDHDRRFFIWEITAEPLSEIESKEFAEWRDADGLSALLHFLLNYNISGFNPKAPAPMTEAKQQMVKDNRSDLECWIDELFSSGANQMLGREIATAHEIGEYYARDTGNKQPSAKAIVGACKRLGACARNNQVRLKNGKKVRILALDRPDYWKQQPEAVWANEMEKPLKNF